MGYQYVTLLNPGPDVFPVFNHSSAVDVTAKHDISAVNDRISIWFLLLQYACTGSENFLRITRLSSTFIGSADLELSMIHRFFRARVIATYRNFNYQPG